MNALRRWIDAKPGRAAALGYFQAFLIMATLLLLGNALLYLYWPGLLGAAILGLIDVWLFLAASTNWRWGGQ